MVSPFPGMDPYLEGYLWPDVHQEISSAIRQLIAPVISPDYVARINTYVVKDSSVKEDIGIMYPDVELLRKENPSNPGGSDSNIAVLTPATVTLPIFPPVEVKIPVIEIKDRQNNTLITAIEILSPVNKRKPGIGPYRKKRKQLHESGVHFLEIDLIRRGERPFEHPLLPESDYLATLSRKETSRTDIWAFSLEENLPVLPVPLRAPDPDVPLDLRKALDLVYERSMYELSINYSEDPPPPALSSERKKWLRQWLTEHLPAT